MMCRRVACLLVALLLVQWSWAAESLSPNDWLEKMSRSHRELSYPGLFTYEHSESIHTLRMFHAIIDGVEYERLEGLYCDDLNVVRMVHGPACMHSRVRFLNLVI